MLAAATGRAAIHAVRVQIIPAPRSLVDSREILRILQGYGEITTYRWLKHDALSSAPNSAMAIFADGEAMDTFLRDCPLTFEIDRVERQESFDNLANDDAEFSEPSAESAENSARDPESASSDPGAKRSDKPKATHVTRPQLFRINADVWKGKHRDWLERHPFWGNFKPDTKSIVQQDLKKRVPLIGLSDIDANKKNEIPIRILQQRKIELAQRSTLKDMIRELRGEEAEQSHSLESSSGHWK
ncbi:uncharacterized protein PV09_00784 [Verruconis gallopava]|uniref:Uncharacterized protein n=1 Tax=Verruconis gallopava TaxID=253628 RepID=A0A0D2AQQ2_9PEZI|nr:uncharacterized protein PV09_00784 [Verruconis gallopava]KIW08860.1 hypothetical protein PV09_00784 [Verruconis gallopava]